MRTRSLAALLAVSMGVAALGAVPARASDTAARPAVAVPKGFGGPGSVPWSSVGTGWILATWSPANPTHVRATARNYLVLISPVGARYLLMPLSTEASLLAWSGDGQRALLQLSTKSSQSLKVLNLRTQTALSTFAVPSATNNSFQGASFTRPRGLALDVATYTNGHNSVARYSLGGTKQVTYPSAFSGVGSYDGAYVSSPDGTELVLGAAHGLATVTNDGTVLAQHPIGGATSCQPKRWWSTTLVLAACGIPSRLYLFSMTGAAPRALTQRPVRPDYGDLSAWRLNSGTYVQVASACGYLYLAKLRGAAPTMVNVPGVPEGNTVLVQGATSTALALVTNLPCQGGPRLLWYTPSKDSTRVILGRPVTSGTPGAVDVFPSPLG